MSTFPITGTYESHRRICAKRTCPSCSKTANRWDEITIELDGSAKTCAVCPGCDTIFGPVQFTGDECVITENKPGAE